LLEVSTQLHVAAPALAAMQMARPSRIERRLCEILDERRNRRPMLRRHLIAASALVGMVAIPIAMLRAEVKAPTPAAAPTTKPADENEAIEKWNNEWMDVAHDMRDIGLASIMYANDHDGKLPHQPGDLLKYMTNPDPEMFLTPAARKQIQLPAKVTAEWVNAHMSYVYLGADASIHKVAPAETVLFHSPLDKPLLDLDGPQRVCTLWVDGHVEINRPDVAEKAVKKSVKAFKDASASR